MDHREATEGILKWKVANPRQSNHIVQMRMEVFKNRFTQEAVKSLQL